MRFEDMHGSGTERHCDACDKKVVDLSALGDAAIREALRSGRCVSFLRAADGSLVRSKRRRLPIAGVRAVVALTAACRAPVRYSGEAPPQSPSAAGPSAAEPSVDAGAAEQTAR